MAFFLSILLFSSVWLSSPILTRASPYHPSEPHSRTHFKRGMTLKAYRDFQISNVPLKDCKQHADLVFLQPFEIVNIVDGPIQKFDPAVDTKICDKMAREASAAESQFNDAIAKASGDDKQALKNGKTCNKVLKLTGAIVCTRLQIEAGKGDPTERQAKVLSEFKKLTKNLEKIQKLEADAQQRSFLSDIAGGPQSFIKTSKRNRRLS